MPIPPRFDDVADIADYVDNRVRALDHGFCSPVSPNRGPLYQLLNLAT